MREVNWGSLELITGATNAIVTTSEFETHAKIPSGTSDIDPISSATALAEKWCNRKFLKQKWRMIFEDVQPVYIEFPFGYLNSVDSVTQYDHSGTATVETQDTTYIVREGEYGTLRLKENQVWTSITYLWYMQVDFFVGRNAITDYKEPEQSNLKRAILDICTLLYINRGAQINISQYADIVGALSTFWIPRL